MTTYEDILELRDSAVPVTWRTLRKHVSEARDFLEEVGAIHGDTTNEQIEGSGFLGFFKGVRRGRPLYFIGWSGYEWIWEEAPQNSPMVRDGTTTPCVSRRARLIGFVERALVRRDV